MKAVAVDPCVTDTANFDDFLKQFQMAEKGPNIVVFRLTS